MITAHRSPDGDAIGSTLGLFHYLKSIGKDVQLWLPDALPLYFNWLPGMEHVNIFEDQRDEGVALLKEVDLIFCLDYNSFSRSGKMARFISQSKAVKVMIDHHRDPDQTFSAMIHDVEASSTCELVFELLELLSVEITQKIAECLYCGLITDTGSFRFAATKRTFEIAAQLLDYGVNNTTIQAKIGNIKSLDSLTLKGYALGEKLKYNMDCHAGYIALTAEELARHNYQKGDTEGLVNEILSIQDTKLAILFSEKEGEVRISFRSVGDLDVNQMASKYFGGGGHKNAAGARSFHTMEETEEVIKKIFEENETVLQA